VLVLAVKPQSMRGVLDELRPIVKPEQLVISIAAGVPLSALATALGAHVRLVRVMPNTPCLVGQGASAYALGSAATPDDAELAQSLLATVGLAVHVPETLLDAVTGLSGSGPAYAFQVIEALSDGGVCAGLPRDVATRLAAQTLLGAAQMVLSTGQHPGALKDAVASPGGTTIAGLHELERGGLRAALMNAVVAATKRSQELGRS
jgi:pyrroline-5-carboxylate reductase